MILFRKHANPSDLFFAALSCIVTPTTARFRLLIIPQHQKNCAVTGDRKENSFFCRSKISFLNPEPGTRNPEPGTRNPEPGTRNPEPESGTRNFFKL